MFLVSNSLFTLFQHSISSLKEWFEIPQEQETVSRILIYKHVSQHSHAFRPQVLEGNIWATAWCHRFYWYNFIRHF